MKQIHIVQTASSLLEILIAMSLIGALLAAIHTTYIAHITLITIAKNNLQLAAQIEELDVDAKACATQK
jgi:hypothetical protein